MRRLETALCLALFCLQPTTAGRTHSTEAAFGLPSRRRAAAARNKLDTQRSSPLASSNLPPPNGDSDSNDEEEEERQELRNIRRKVKQLANNFVVRPIVSTVPLPRAIASVLKDATVGAVDMAVEEVLSRRQTNANGNSGLPSSNDAINFNVTDLVNDAFAPMELSLIEMEQALKRARLSMAEAKEQATEAIEAVQVAAIAQAAGAATAVAAAEEVASQEILADIYDDTVDVDVSTLTYDDVGYHQSEMDPPFLDEAQCLVPGEAIVRVEKAPENSRRIFAGIDIFASVDDVWKVINENADVLL